MYNKVILVGEVGPKGVDVRPQREGTMVGSFLLKLTESSEAGRTFTSFHLIECYGRALQTAERLTSGDVVLCEGKLRRRKLENPDRWDTTVVALSVQKLPTGVAAQEVA
jgi:single-stranded DNA-binding protein